MENWPLSRQNWRTWRFRERYPTFWGKFEEFSNLDSFGYTSGFAVREDPARRSLKQAKFANMPSLEILARLTDAS